VLGEVATWNGRKLNPDNLFKSEEPESAIRIEFEVLVTEIWIFLTYAYDSSKVKPASNYTPIYSYQN
jgi:hypothetical protein